MLLWSDINKLISKDDILCNIYLFKEYIDEIKLIYRGILNYHKT